jgi:hypothetical protein
MLHAVCHGVGCEPLFSIYVHGIYILLAAINHWSTNNIITHHFRDCSVCSMS